MASGTTSARVRARWTAWYAPREGPTAMTSLDPPVSPRTHGRTASESHAT